MRGLKTFALICCALAIELSAQSLSAALTNEDVAKLEHASLSDALVIAIIQRMPVRFTLDAAAQDDLKQNGVSPDVISAMVRKELASDAISDGSTGC